MKKMTMGMFSLAALVGMATISAQAVRAEAGASLEAAKQESGVEFGETGGPNGGGSSAVRAFDKGISRPAVMVLNRKAMQGRPEIPSPARGSKGGWLKAAKIAVGIPAAALGATFGFVGGILMTGLVAAVSVLSLGTLLFMIHNDGGMDGVLGFFVAPITYAVKGGRMGYKAVEGAFKNE